MIGKAKESISKHNAKIRCIYIKFLKNNLDHAVCDEEATAFIRDYAEEERNVWKYLYRVYTIRAKLYQILNSLEKSHSFML